MLADGPVPSTEPDAATSQAPEKEAEAVVPIPAGRLSKVESAAPHPSYQIQTEGENRPNFTVTTIINRGGQIIRKVRTSWQHPLKKRADERLARAQIDRQHERVVSGLNEMIKARSLPPQAAGISSLLLIWVMHFIIEQTWVHLGTSVAVAVLRRTRASLARRFEVLKYFQVEEDAKVQVDPSPGQQLPADSVAAVAAWSARYLAEAARIVPDVGRLRVRQATILMEHALDQVGFYAAFDQAAAELALNQPQDARVSTGA
jgi:hypothetical protein